MSRTVRLASAATAELEEAARWYNDQRRGLGGEFLAAVADAVDSLRNWSSKPEVTAFDDSV